MMQLAVYLMICALQPKAHRAVASKYAVAGRPPTVTVLGSGTYGIALLVDPHTDETPFVVKLQRCKKAAALEMGMMAKAGDLAARGVPFMPRLDWASEEHDVSRYDATLSRLQGSQAKFKKWYRDGKLKCAFQTERLDGDLYHLLREEQQSKHTLVCILRQLVLAVYTLHTHFGHNHGDLHLGNVLYRTVPGGSRKHKYPFGTRGDMEWEDGGVELVLWDFGFDSQHFGKFNTTLAMDYTMCLTSFVRLLHNVAGDQKDRIAKGVFDRFGYSTCKHVRPKDDVFDTRCAVPRSVAPSSHRHPLEKWDFHAYKLHMAATPDVSQGTDWEVGLDGRVRITRDTHAAQCNDSVLKDAHGLFEIAEACVQDIVKVI